MAQNQSPQEIRAQFDNSLAEQGALAERFSARVVQIDEEVRERLVRHFVDELGTELGTWLYETQADWLIDELRNWLKEPINVLVVDLGEMHLVLNVTGFFRALDDDVLKQIMEEFISILQKRGEVIDELRTQHARAVVTGRDLAEYAQLMREFAPGSTPPVN
jgi:hypothetical protein